MLGSRKQSLFFVVFIILGFVNNTVAQRTQSPLNWYFGGAPNALQFNRVDDIYEPIVATDQIPSLGLGGSATASEPNTGNLLFYTDGVTVYDFTHNPTPRGTGLIGNPVGNQAAAVSAVPGQIGDYYIFTNTANGTTGGEIRHNVFRMTENGNTPGFPAPPFGDLVLGQRNLLTGINNTSEAMIVIANDALDGFWLITHQNGTTNYTVTTVDNLGFTNNTFNNLGSVSSAVNFSYNSATNKIAVSPFDPAEPVTILDFDPVTGTLTFDTNVTGTAFGGAITPSVCDTEWSSDGRFLYISQTGDNPGNNGEIFQFDFDNPTNTIQPILPAPVNRSFGLQMAPDSAIYHLYQETAGGPFLLGRIDSAGMVAPDVFYDPQPLGDENFNGRQFPAFLPNFDAMVTLSFTSLGDCANAPVYFFPEIVPSPDSITWDFGDGNFSDAWAPFHTYEMDGPVTVTMTAFLNNQPFQTTLDLNLQQFDVTVTLPMDTTACRDEFPPPRGSSSPVQFTVPAQISGNFTSIQWSNDSTNTSTTLFPDSAGVYFVVVEAANGCQTSATVTVNEFDLVEQNGYIWYFGDNAGIDFNPIFDGGNPVALNDGAMMAPEGCAAVSDPNGVIIFYTDGDNVYNKENQLIATGIGGEVNSAQSAAILPFPDDETLYYIFTTQEVYGTNTYEVRYSIFDFKLNDITGEVISQDNLLFSRSTERLGIPAGENWIVTHEYGNNNFRAYPITQGGIGDPVITSIGSDHTFSAPEEGQGYMKISDNNRLAVGVTEPGVSNIIELFTFNPGTGVVSDSLVVDLNQPNGFVYGMEFSGSGNRLYVTVTDLNGFSELYQIDVEELVNPTGTTPVLTMIASSAGENWGALQIGPDQRIYMAKESGGGGGLNALDVIGSPEGIGAAGVGYLPNGFALAGGTASQLGLPVSRAQPPNQTQPGFSVTSGCFGDSTSFSATQGIDIDEFLWTVFRIDQATGTRQQVSISPNENAQSFSHLFTEPGEYEINLLVFNRCNPAGTPQTPQTILILPLPEDPTDPNSPEFQFAANQLICSNQPVDLDATVSGGAVYEWSLNGTVVANTPTITITQTGMYDLRIENADGCPINTIVDVQQRLPVDLGADQTVCQNSTPPDLDAQVVLPQGSYTWTVNGGAPTVGTGNGRLQAIDTSVPGVFTYAVSFADPNDPTCIITDEVVITVQEFSASVANIVNSTLGCGPGGNGNFTVNVNGSGDFTIVFRDAGGNVIATPNNDLAPGSYTVEITDNINVVCQPITLNAIIGNDGGTFNIDQATPTDAGCDDQGANIEVTLTGAPIAPWNYTLRDANNNIVATGASSANPFDITDNVAGADFGPGTYSLEVNDGSCDDFVGGIVIARPPTADLQIDDIFTECDDALTFVASSTTPNVNFTWEFGASGQQSFATPFTPPLGQLGQSFVTITATDPGGAFCDSVRVVEVNLTPPPVIELVYDSSNICAGQVGITAVVTNDTGSAGQLFEWSTGEITDQIVITASGTYSVTVRNNPQVSCLSMATTPQIDVPEAPQFSLESDPACGGPDDEFIVTLVGDISNTEVFWFREDTPGNRQSIDPSDIIAPGNAIRVTDATTYGVAIIPDGLPCQFETFITIDTKSPFPTTDLPTSGIICTADPNPLFNTVTLDPGDSASNFNNIVYFDPFGNQLTPGPGFVLVVDDFGTYTAQISNNFGCVVEQEIDIVEDCRPRIVAPNAFRPNGSSLADNSTFSIVDVLIADEDFQILIFNRWGEIVFESADKEFTWNGGFANDESRLLPGGVYTYIVRFRGSVDGEMDLQEERGGVLLIR
ncbi:MAG: gliding motility-associated C-terminal domain-containing protein [Bacteroidota bacterium]